MYSEKTLLMRSSACKFRFFRMWLLLVTVLGLVSGNSMETEGKMKVNPELSLNISERIQYWGYPAEEYEVLTEDGYYLSLNRIPGSKASILLVHGLVAEGSSWISNPPHESLGFILADAHYDVWIGNLRGTFWSQKHINLTIDQEEFWDFSFHEMGIYDLPSMIYFILQKTGQEKIYLAGHSQGNTVAFVGLSVIPQLAEKIEMYFALAPVYTGYLSISPIIIFLKDLPQILFKIMYGRKEFRLLTPSLRKLLSETCSFRAVDVLCKQVIQLVAGFNEKNLNKSRTDVYFSTYPDYTSVKNIIHWRQVAKTGEFRYFDYGPNNINKYNQPIPPFYEIEEITVPIAVWNGEQDWVVRPNEISQLLPRIHNLIHAEKIPDWTHWDFIWGIDAHQRVYAAMLGLMEQSLCTRTQIKQVSGCQVVMNPRSLENYTNIIIL